MPITVEQWAEVENASLKLWKNETDRKKDYIALNFDRQPTSDLYEYFEGLGAMGHMSPWTGSIQYQDPGKGFKQTFKQERFSTGVQAEEWMFRYSKYRQIADRVTDLHESVYQTYQASAASLFNNASNAAYVGPDSVALCSTSHPMSPADATVQSNLGSLDLTMANLNTAFNAMLGFTNDKHDIIGVTPDTLMYGIYYRDKALKITGGASQAKEPFTADNDKNIYSDLKGVFNPRLTGKEWFLIDSQRQKRFLKWFDGRMPDFKTNNDFNTEMMEFAVISDWTRGWTNWDWIYGSFS